MSATTNLKFTLTSPGNNNNNNNNNTTPTPNNTTTGTGTITYVGSPNTGDNTTTDNGSGTVFMTLFIAVGLAALIVFLVRYLKKNRRLSFAPKGSFHLSARPRVFATVGLVLAIAFLGSSILIKSYSDSRADAAGRELGISVASDMTFNVDRGQTAYLTDNVVVTTGGSGYTLEVSTDNSKFCLENSTTACLTSTSGDITSSTASGLSSLGTNEWGMSLNGTDTSANIWGAVPTTAKVIANKASTSSATDTTKVYYGVNVGDDLPDGTYYGKVIYTAYAKDVRPVDYQVTTINGYVGKDGIETEERYDENATVYIRPNCPANQTFTGWTTDDLEDVNLITGPDGDGLYKFVMPANDVELTAHCSGETPANWIIKYNANAPSNTTPTGTMADTAVTGVSATLTANAFAITNYTFKGWSCTSGKPTDASLIHFTNSQAGITKTVLEEKGCTKSGSPDTYNLYAIWEYQMPTVSYIQEVTPEMCDNMQLFQVMTLPDRRDNKNYSFTKYADGRCWMLQDLNYTPSAGSVALTTADTDISADRTVTFATSGTSGAVYHTQSGYSTLYNYNAATGGYWNSWSSKAANRVVPDSLCPASWKIPDASYGPRWINGQLVIDQAFGVEAGEFYGLWNANIGKANTGGTSKSSTWKTQTFIFGSGTAVYNNKTVTYPHFTYNGAWNFSSGTWADESGNAANGAAGKYASYFLNTTVTREGSIAPAAYNPHKPGVEAGDPDIEGIGDTDPAHGSSVRCVLRTAEQRTNRSYPAGGSDITD